MFLQNIGQIKKEYKTEKYISMNLTKRQRSILAQLRFGILPLRIETGRFRGEKVEERVCQLCNTGLVEYELHFLFRLVINMVVFFFKFR